MSIQGASPRGDCGIHPPAVWAVGVGVVLGADPRPALLPLYYWDPAITLLSLYYWDPAITLLSIASPQFSHSPIQIVFILTLQQNLLIEVGELGLQDCLLNPGILVHLLKAILATDHPKELDAMSAQWVPKTPV